MPSVRDDPFFRKPDPNALSNKIMRNLLPQQEHTDRDAAISGLRDLFIAKDTALRAAEKRVLTLEQESKRLESQLHELMLNPGRNVSDAHAEANVPSTADSSHGGSDALDTQYAEEQQQQPRAERAKPEPTDLGCASAGHTPEHATDGPAAVGEDSASSGGGSEEHPRTGEQEGAPDGGVATTAAISDLDVASKP